MGPGAFPLARHGACCTRGCVDGDGSAAYGAICDRSRHARCDAARSGRNIFLLFAAASKFGRGCKDSAADNGCSTASNAQDSERSGTAVAHFLVECLSMACRSLAVWSRVVQFAI